MLQQVLLYFRWGDHLAPAAYQLLHTTVEVQVAVLVQITTIAGIQPALLERRRRAFRIVPVLGKEHACHRGRRSDLAFFTHRQDMPFWIAYRDLDPATRAPDGAHTFGLLCIHRDPAASLRHAIKLTHLDAEAALHFSPYTFGRAPAHAPFQAMVMTLARLLLFKNG